MLKCPEHLSSDDFTLATKDMTFYHEFVFENGIKIPGWWDVASTIPEIEFPDLEGKRILDIGPASGYFSFYFEQQGAIVTALEISDSSQFNKYGYIENQNSMSGNNGVFNTSTFLTMKALLNSQVEYVQGSIYQLGLEVLSDRKFDLVFVGSLLVHLRDPIGGLSRAASVCSDQLIATNSILNSDKNALPYMRMIRPFKDSIDWWLPNYSCFNHWFLAAGFDEVNSERTLTQYAAASRPSVVKGDELSPIHYHVAHARI